jgi:hypothetical protein
MTSSPRGRRAWKILLILLAVPLLGAVSAALWINRVADRRWADAQERIRLLAAAWPAETPGPRAPVSETSKHTQSDFVGAIREAVRRSSRLEESWRLLRLKALGADAGELLFDADDFLQRLHQGARRSVESPSEFPRSWRGEWDLNTLTFIMNCSILRSRRFRELGRPAEAATPLLDFLQLSRFWAESGRNINRIQAMGNIVRILDELRDLLSREKLLPEELRRIEGELEFIDSWVQFPFRGIEAGLARWSEGLLSLDPKDQGLLEEASWRWRFLLPERFMKSEAFEFSDRHVRSLLDCEGKPYAELLGRQRDLYGEMERSLNPIIRTRSFFWEDPGWNVLQRRAELRLLRMAARYRATGEILRLEDPFGTVLLHSTTGSRMKFWSAGVDGKDDGGDPGRSGQWRNPMSGDEGKDVVIEVERPRSD